MSLRRLNHQAFRTLLFSVLIALVFAQTLGALHRVVHASRAVPLPGTAAPAATAAATPAGAHVGVFERLFAGHDSERACDQYDQLNHVDLAFGAHLVLVPAAVAAGPEVSHPGWHLAAQAAGFLARGPPARA